MEIRDLLFSEYPMFDRVMEERTDLCQRLLETVLGMPIAKVSNVVAERTLQPRIGAHGVRLDVMARTSGAVYDVEMQTYSREGLGKRMRYYQGAMDTAMLTPGVSYDNLPNSFIIFICLQDDFGAGLPVYTFDMRCEENDGVELGHGFIWSVLNASAWEELPDEQLRGLLRYIATEDAADDELATDLAVAVAAANADGLWKEGALTMLTIEEDMRAQGRLLQKAGWEKGLAEGRAAGMAEGRAAGMAEGRVEGRAAGLAEAGALMASLMDAGRFEDARRAATDADYREELLRDLGQS